MPDPATQTPSPACRLCGAPLDRLLVDLGIMPLANAYVRPERLGEPEPSYPLRAYVCGHCFLVQSEAVLPPAAIFTDYAYFSSYSDTLLARSRGYADAMIDRLALAPGERVIEIASNDGYLLRFFRERGMQVLGVEPAVNIADEARRSGIETINTFFSAAVARSMAEAGQRARLVVANNVLAHVPDIHDFIDGLRLLLEPGGLVSVEVHHVLNLIAATQFDNIYHEHLSYFSLDALRRLFAEHGLTIVDVEEIPSQGGSLRVLARDAREAAAVAPSVDALIAREIAAGLQDPGTYTNFTDRVARIRRDLVAFLAEAREKGQTVLAYGAAAKGNTLLNYCGVTPELVEAVVDRNPHKQHLLLPGSHIPIEGPEYVDARHPDYLLILPWNICDEIRTQMGHIASWGARFVTAIPALLFFP